MPRAARARASSPGGRRARGRARRPRAPSGRSGGSTPAAVAPVSAARQGGGGWGGGGGGGGGGGVVRCAQRSVARRGGDWPSRRAVATRSSRARRAVARSGGRARATRGPDPSCMSTHLAALELLEEPLRLALNERAKELDEVRVLRHGQAAELERERDVAHIVGLGGAPAALPLLGRAAVGAGRAARRAVARLGEAERGGRRRGELARAAGEQHLRLEPHRARRRAAADRAARDRPDERATRVENAAAARQVHLRPLELAQVAPHGGARAAPPSERRLRGHAANPAATFRRRRGDDAL